MGLAAGAILPAVGIVGNARAGCGSSAGLAGALAADGHGRSLRSRGANDNGAFLALISLRFTIVRRARMLQRIPERRSVDKCPVGALTGNDELPHQWGVAARQVVPDAKRDVAVTHAGRLGEEVAVSDASVAGEFDGCAHGGRGAVWRHVNHVASLSSAQGVLHHHWRALSAVAHADEGSGCSSWVRRRDEKVHLLSYLRSQRNELQRSFVCFADKDWRLVLHHDHLGAIEVERTNFGSSLDVHRLS